MSIVDQQCGPQVLLQRHARLEADMMEVRAVADATHEESRQVSYARALLQDKHPVMAPS